MWRCRACCLTRVASINLPAPQLKPKRSDVETRRMCTRAVCMITVGPSHDFILPSESRHTVGVRKWRCAGLDATFRENYP
jgi:hypothetical protein